MMLALLLALFAGAAPDGAPMAFPPAEVCELLTADDINAVQKVTLKERKPSAESAKGLRFAQCFYAAGDFARSISLTVISDQMPAAKPRALRAFWQETFNPQRNFGRKSAPRAIAALGDAAFWTSDARAGVLYVLAGDAVIRLSVGGVADEAERLARTTSLARTILRRLPPVDIQ